MGVAYKIRHRISVGHRNSLTYTYDDRGRLTRETFQSGSEYYDYEYAADGQVSKISTFTQTNSEQTQFGPEIFVVEYSYDNSGRMIRKVVRNNSSQDSTVRYGSDYTYDGMGRMVRERIWRWDQMIGRIVTTQDVKTTYDLAGNPTKILFSDSDGWAYEETRTYVSSGNIQVKGCRTTSSRSDRL